MQRITSRNEKKLNAAFVSYEKISKKTRQPETCSDFFMKNQYRKRK